VILEMIVGLEVFEEALAGMMRFSFISLLFDLLGLIRQLFEVIYTEKLTG
jgi:hypothetical protein